MSGHCMAGRLLLCVLYAALFLKTAADITPSNTALLGFVQSHQDPRYMIKYHPPGTIIHQDPDQETIMMTDGEKRKYECTLPLQEEQQGSKDESSQQNSSSSVSLVTNRRVSKTPDDLLMLLKNQCVWRHEGWWTYEFCCHGKLRQLHIEKNKVVQEFELGVYDAEATAALHVNSSYVSLQKDHRSKSSAQRYHSHLYTNGTMCDLTNEPRETEVRFICSDTGKNMISSITEVSTCKYMLLFHTPALCQHPLFQEERPRFLTIDCVEVSSTPEVVEKYDEDEQAIGGLLPSVSSEEEKLS